MATFNFNYWWASVGIEDLQAKILLKNWFREKGLTTRDALMGLQLRDLPPKLLSDWKLAILSAVKRLCEFTHRYFYHASFILNAAFFCIGV